MGWEQSGLYCSLGCWHAPSVGKSCCAFRSVMSGRCSLNVFGLIMKEGVKLLQTIDLCRNGLMTLRAKIIPLSLSSTIHLSMPGTPRHWRQWVVVVSPHEPLLQKWKKKALQTYLVIIYRAYYIPEQRLDPPLFPSSPSSPQALFTIKSP